MQCTLTPLSDIVPDPVITSKSITELLSQLEEILLDYRDTQDPSVLKYVIEIVTDIWNRYNKLERTASWENQEIVVQDASDSILNLDSIKQVFDGLEININNAEQLDNVTYKWSENALTSLLSNVATWCAYNRSDKINLNISRKGKFLFIDIESDVNDLEPNVLLNLKNKCINRDLNVSVWKETYIMNNIIESLNTIEGWALELSENSDWLGFSLLINCDEAELEVDMLDVLMEA